MDREDKARICELLRVAGLGKPAGLLREEIRLALKAAGVEPEQATSTAWTCVEKLATALAPKFQVLNRPTQNDPAYSEEDAATKIRDAYLWIHDYFAQIVTDSPAGTTVDYQGIPAPPTTYALTVLETWAAKPISGRDGLHREIRAVMPPTPEPEPEVVEIVTMPPPPEPVPVEYAG